MKFIKFFALASVLAFTGNAAAEETTYAPEANDFSLEVSFNPFSNDFSTFQLDQIKARIFFTNKDALRIGLGFGVNSHKNTPKPDEEDDVWTKESGSNFSLDLGYERNFYNYKRINLYGGAGLGFTWQKDVTTTQRLVADNTYGKEASYTGDWGFYAKAFTGIDFFIYKGLFIGAELNLKIGVSNDIRPYTKGGYNDNGTWSDNYESKKGPKSSDFVLGLGAEPALRLGWCF